MAETPASGRPIDSHTGWQSLTRVLSSHVPYALTQGGNARKALYALMYPTRR